SARACTRRCSVRCPASGRASRASRGYRAGSGACSRAASPRRRASDIRRWIACSERRVTARLCEASAPELASPWTEETRFALRRSFENTKLGYASQILARVEANLDRWNAELESTRGKLCDPGL